MISEHLAKANRGTGNRTGPERYPTLSSVATYRMFPILCLNAFHGQEVILSPFSSSTFGHLSLLEGAWFPWVDICLPRAVNSSVLSSLWNLLEGLSPSHMIHEVFSPFFPPDFRHCFILPVFHYSIPPYWQSPFPPTLVTVV